MQKIRRLIEIQVENQIVPAVKLDEWVVRNLRVIQFSHEPVRIERKILKSRWKSMKVKEERKWVFHVARRRKIIYKHSTLSFDCLVPLQ